MRLTDLAGATVLILAGCQTAVEPHDHVADINVQVTDLGHGIFELRTDQSGNVGLLVGADGVFMIDTQMERLVQSIDESQKHVSGGSDVDLVLNTHLHRDHVRGNAYFAERGAQIMAHPNVRKYLQESRAITALGRDAPIIPADHLPSINVDAGTTITMNGQTARLYHAPAAHTDGDIFIHFEEANIVHAGDLLVTHRFPFIDVDNGGSVQGYIAGMKSILEVADEETVIIAGHGPLASRNDLEDSIRILTDVHNLVAELVDKGLNLKEIQHRAPLARYAEAWDWEFINSSRMTTILYYDLTGQLD
jgi:cyclase